MFRRDSLCLALAISLMVLSATACDRLAPGPRRNAGPTAAAPRVLVQGRTVTGRLGRGGNDRYEIAVDAGEYVGVTIEQRQGDVSAAVQDTTGATIAEFDDEVRPRHDEHIGFVAEASGAFTLTVHNAHEAIAAGEYSIRVAAMRPAGPADRAQQHIRTLQVTASRLEAVGCFDEARATLEGALTEARRAWGDEHTQVAIVTARLAAVYLKLADTAKSQLTYEQAAAILERTLGARHPSTALVRSELADVYRREGDRRRAETLLHGSLDVLEQTLGERHPWVVTALLALGNLYDAAGDLDAEEATVQRALMLSERIRDTDSEQYAELVNNLGEVYRQRHAYTRAAGLFERALALDEHRLGPDDYSIATVLQNLGIVARERGDLAAAEAYNLRALSIRQRVVGDDHPDVAHILINLGNVYRARGDYARSLDAHFRALHTWEHAAGRYPQPTLLALGNIARTYAAMGDVKHALTYERRADAMVERLLALNVSVGSERQKEAFARSVAERTDRTLSLHLQQAPRNRQAAALAARVLLQRKGRVQESMTDVMAPIRARVTDRGDRELMAQLNEITSNLARLALTPQEPTPHDARQVRFQQLQRDEERIEATLSEHSAELRARLQPVSLESVQAALPGDATLLEFAVYRPFVPAAERSAGSYGAPRYAVYVIRKDTSPVGIDLGESATIEPLVDAWREALRDPARGDVDARARLLHERVFRPIGKLVAGASRLLVAPDGALNLVPFEALRDEHGRYLIERYGITYLTSGRDLLRLGGRRPDPTSPVIVADPLFGETDDKDVYFPRLAATAGEARELKSLFHDAVVLTGSQATKTGLQGLHAPLLLHIASHGFFLGDEGSDRVLAYAGENPLLRSGLALARANLGHGARGEGILTALEASRLDLWGTKLVTLSACDSGIGEVRNGEGVYGLRRAFELAGAETLVMTLWAIDDYATRDAMIAYYTGLRHGLGRGDALRRMQLTMLRRPSRRHPYYWAGFIQSGEWRSLRGR